MVYIFYLNLKITSYSSTTSLYASESSLIFLTLPSTFKSSFCVVELSVDAAVNIASVICKLNGENTKFLSLFFSSLKIYDNMMIFENGPITPFFYRKIDCKHIFVI